MAKKTTNSSMMAAMLAATMIIVGLRLYNLNNLTDMQ